MYENSEVDTCQCTVRTENTHTSEAASDILLWMAAKLFWMVYCYMHLGAFQEALERLDQVCSLSHSCQFCVTMSQTCHLTLRLRKSANIAF